MDFLFAGANYQQGLPNSNATLEGGAREEIYI
jgi:hypothetical protein